MALGPGLHIRQAQTLVMSQQLQQADGLLQLRRQDERLRLPDIETWAE